MNPPSPPDVRVAVVVPCYNDGHFIKEALASLEDQEGHELVVVDDGSEDQATLDVLASLAEHGTRVVRRENGGLGPARMTGVASTRARFIHPLDSDDRLAPGALAVLADALDANPDAAAAWGSYHTFGSSDCHFPTAPRLDPWRITYLDEIPGTTMLRREAIEAVGGWDPIAYEDWDLWLKLAERGLSGVGVPATTLFYREHATPRLLARTTVDHGRHYQNLRNRHAALFAARRRNRRASEAPRGLKVLLPLIDHLPIAAAKKRQLWGMARYLFQREMSSDCYRSPGRRLLDAARQRTERRDPIDAVDV